MRSAIKVSTRQRDVLCLLWQGGTICHPRHSLERLEKKGLAIGNRRDGWRLSRSGVAMVIAILREDTWRTS